MIHSNCIIALNEFVQKNILFDRSGGLLDQSGEGSIRL